MKFNKVKEIPSPFWLMTLDVIAFLHLSIKPSMLISDLEEIKFFYKFKVT
jgi:hypothetical protein